MRRLPREEIGQRDANDHADSNTHVRARADDNVLGNANAAISVDFDTGGHVDFDTNDGILSNANGSGRGNTNSNSNGGSDTDTPGETT